MRAKAWVDVVHGMQTSSILGYCLLPMVLLAFFSAFLATTGHLMSVTFFLFLHDPSLALGVEGLGFRVEG